jgi:hypothetical protein
MRMKADPIIQELEAVKDHLAEKAGGDLRRFLDQMEAWQAEHPHAGPAVKSPEELQARLRHREAVEPPPPPVEPYRVYDPIIAEVHRVREQLYRETQTAPLILKDESSRKKV